MKYIYERKRGFILSQLLVSAAVMRQEAESVPITTMKGFKFVRFILEFYSYKLKVNHKISVAFSTHVRTT